jgi:hypothetical protein
MPKIPEQIELVDKIKPFLTGHDPSIQGAALAELLALWLAGHHPDLRHEMLDLHIDTVRELVPVAEAEIFGNGPRPEGWEPPRA